MSKAGCPYDNAPMERFYNTFKSNFYNVTSFSNVEVMDELTTKYINWYNYVRPHSHNNYLTPMEARYKQVFIEQSVTKKLDQYKFSPIVIQFANFIRKLMKKQRKQATIQTNDNREKQISQSRMEEKK